MGKKSAHSGESPKERSINKMDKFITRNERRNKHIELLPTRRKDPNVPINLWPLKDQLDYYANRTAEDKFTDYISKLDDIIKEMYNTCIPPKDAARVLEKHGVY